MDEKTKYFLERYEVKVLDNTKPCLRRSRKNQYFTDPKNADVIKDNAPKTEVDKLLTIQIPEFYFKRLIDVENKFFAGESNNDVVRRLFDTMIDKQFEETYLRNQNESLKKAWENYSLLLHLVRFKKEPVDSSQ